MKQTTDANAVINIIVAKIIAANNTSIETLAEMVDAQLAVTPVPVPGGIFGKLWSELSYFGKIPPMNSTNDSVAEFMQIYFEHVDYVLTPEERILLAAKFADKPLRSTDALLAFWTEQKDVIRKLADRVRVYERLNDIISLRTPLPLLVQLTTNPVPDSWRELQHHGAQLPGMPVPNAKFALGEPDANTKQLVAIRHQLGGLQPTLWNFAYYVGTNPKRRQIMQTTVIKAVDTVEQWRMKPDQLVLGHSRLLLKNPTLRAATDYAAANGVLVPALAEYYEEIADFIEYMQPGIDQGEFGDKIKATQVYQLTNRFYNDLFLKTGRVNEKWTITAVKQVLRNAEWQQYQGTERRYVAQILAALMEFLEQAVGLKNGAKLIDAVYAAFGLTAAQAEGPEITLAKKVIVFAPTAKTNADEIIATNDVTAMLLADGWTVSEFIDSLLRGRHVSNEHRGWARFAANWWQGFVRPTYSLKEAASAFGLPLIMREENFWDEAMKIHIPAHEPMPTERRVRIAVQLFAGQMVTVTAGMLEVFADKFHDVLAEIGVDASALRRLVPVVVPVRQGKVLSLAAAKKLMRKKNKRK